MEKAASIIFVSLLMSLFIPQLFAQGGGNALDFDGTNDYISVSDHSSLSFGDGSTDNAFSLSMWVYATSTDVSRILSKEDLSGSNDEWRFQIDPDSDLGFYLFDGGTGNRISRKADISSSSFLNNWKHIVVTYSGGGQYTDIKMYIDEAEATYSDPWDNAGSYIAMHNTSTPIALGAYTGGSSPFSGKIDEVRIWNVTRTQTQIQANMFKQISGTTSGLVGYWRLNESSGTNATDETTNNNDGTLNNMNDADWVSSTAPIASSTTSDKTDLTAVWSADNTNASSIMTITDSDISGTDCIIFGHDNASLSANTSDVPSGINRRLNRVWRLEEYGTLTGNIVFDCSNLGIGDGNDLRLLYDSDGTFSSGATTVTGSYSDPNFTVSSHSFQNGYYYTLASTTTDNSLPVELTSFTVRQEKTSAILEWITESEIENLGFILERRKKEGDYWKEIASYITNSELQGQGSVTYRTEYTFADNTVLPGITYEYRLSDVSYDGVVEYHGTVEVTVKAIDEIPLPYDFVFKSVYPNPFNPVTTIEYVLANEMAVSLIVIDLIGRTVRRLVEKQTRTEGEHSVKWNGKDDYGVYLPSGVYFSVLEARGMMKSQKIVLLR